MMTPNRTVDEIGSIERAIVLGVFLAVVVGAILLLTQLMVWGYRWHCESRLAYMGLEGTTPPYSGVCYVYFQNGKAAPLHQIRWGPDGNHVPPA